MKFKVRVETIMRAEVEVEAENYESAVRRLDNGDYDEIIGDATANTDDLDTSAKIVMEE